MDPRVLLFAGGKPHIEAAGLILTEDGAWSTAATLTGTLFTKAPTFFTGIVTPGSTIQAVGSFGTANSTSAGTTLALTPTTTVEAGNLAVLVIANDATATVDGISSSTAGAPSSEVASITDTGGNTWQLIGSVATQASTTAANNVATTIWKSVITTQLTGADTITITFTASIAAKAATGHEFTTAGAAVISAEDVYLAGTTGVMQSLTLADLPSREYLLIRGLGAETNSVTAFTNTANYTPMTTGLADTGVAATSVEARAEFRILTGTGDTSAPSWISIDHATIYVALFEGAAPVRPSIVSGGPTVNGSAAGVTPPWPVHEVNDVALLVCEVGAADTATFSAANGFAAVANSPQSPTGSKLYAFWCRATSTSMAAPVFNDPGDHIVAKILLVKGCITTGDPWDVTAGDTSTASTSVSIPGATTTVAETLVVAISSQDIDNTAAQFSAWANADLTRVRELYEAATGTGTGGGFGVAIGRKAVAGAYGAITATVGNTTQGRLSIALRPLISAVTGVLFTNTPTFPVGTVSTGTVTLTGSLFVKAPTFLVGVVSLAETQPLTGTLFTTAPTFPVGVVSLAGALNGTLFTTAPTFPSGSVTAAFALTGSLFVEAPTFPSGTVTGTFALTGTLFTKAPTFPVGVVSLGAGGTQNLTGTLFTKAPTFFVGMVVEGEIPRIPTPAVPGSSIRIEVWSLPDDVDGFRLLCEPPFLNGTSFQDRADVYGGGQLIVPADYEHLALIVDVDPSDIESSHSAIIRGLQFWPTDESGFDGEWHVVWEFFADEAEEQISRDGQRVVTITGLDVRAAPDDGIVYPRFPLSPHWEWGAPTRIENPSFEDTGTNNSEVQLSINATAGTFTIGIDYPAGTGYVYTGNISFNPGTADIAIAIEALMVGWDVLVTGAGTDTNPFVIELINPAGVQAGWVTDSGGLTGLASILYVTIGGQSVLEPWTRSFNPATGLFHGYYTTFEVSTEQARTGTNSLKITGQLGPWAGSFPGAQQIVSVEEGQDWAAIWVYPLATGMFRFVIRTTDETYIASDSTVLSAGSWQEIRIPVVNYPAYAAQVIYRIARIDDSSTPATWFVDDAMLAPGFPATTWGDILSVLMSEAFTRGTLDWLELDFDAAVDSDGVAWDTDEFAFQADALMKLGTHVIGDGEAAGYEHDVVAIDPPGVTTHQLRAYNPLGRGDVSLQAAVVGAFNAGRVAKRRVPYTHLLLELNDGSHVEVTDPRVAGFGRRERGVRVEQATDVVTAVKIGAAIFDKEIPNLLAVQTTFTGHSVLPYRHFDIGWIVSHTLGRRALKHDRRIQVITTAFTESRWVYVVTSSGVEAES